MATIIPSTALRPCTITLTLPPRDRRAVERQIEALIDLLDTLDGDPELEDDELGDDILDLGEAAEGLPTLPIYATDQSRGPRNFDDALRAYRRSFFEQAA